MKCESCYQAKGPACDDPRKLAGQPIGQYHCPGCGVMQCAGIEHLDCEDCNGTGEVTPETIIMCGGWGHCKVAIKDMPTHVCPPEEVLKHVDEAKQFISATSHEHDIECCVASCKRDDCPSLCHSRP